MKKLFIISAIFGALGAQAAAIPRAATLQYSGSYGIPATMTFKRTGDNYTIAANIKVPMYQIRFESGGKIVNGILKPTYYRDTRNGKLYASAQMTNGKITLGKVGETHSEAVSGNVMDLFTLSWQLAFSEGKLPSGLSITNGKKLYRAGNLNTAGKTTLTINGQKTDVNRLSVKRDDSLVQYGFAPSLGNVPAWINYTDGGKKYNLTLKSAQITE